MDKERFHNTLALTLGYERIVKDKRYNIIVDDNADEPKITIKDQDGCVKVSFKVSEVEGINENIKYVDEIDQYLCVIIKAVHQAYVEATNLTYCQMINL